MKLLKIFGLTLFTTGFLLYNALFFWSDHILSRAAVEEKITDETKRTLFLEEASTLIGVKEETNFAFVSHLTGIFEKINEQQLKKYDITEEELNRISDLGTRFSFAGADSVFRMSNETAAFRINAFKAYGSGLEAKQFSSKEDLRSALNNVAANIRKYEIVKATGFDRYQIKELKYTLTKASSHTPVKDHPLLLLFLTIGMSCIGALLYIVPKVREPENEKVNNTFFNPMKNTGWLGILTGTYLIAFYLLLYFFPEYMTTSIIMTDPLSELLNGHEASRFFLYGFIYTLCILVMGIRMIIYHRSNRYQLIRTLSVIFFQTSFAFLIPEILVRLNRPYYDFKNIWPLDYTFFFDYRLDQMLSNGTLGLFMLAWGIALIVVAVPVLVYFFGKRWYCSWVCGCGGLAETFGDPYRHLSDKRLKAWKIERWMVHGVLVFAVLMTMAVLYTFFTKSSRILFIDSYAIREIYGVFIGAGFAGVVGTGFYPLMGNRVWCRFGCPLAAYLGFVQRFKSRFRITTNGGQCISCGNCSTYCEMGIDVRWYAQRGQNIIRSSCVGCGICSAVCPRGVLNLEVKDETGRFGKPILIGNNNITIVP